MRWRDCVLIADGRIECSTPESVEDAKRILAAWGGELIDVAAIRAAHAKLDNNTA